MGLSNTNVHNNTERRNLWLKGIIMRREQVIVI
jgi:hypothetical protein